MSKKVLEFILPSKLQEIEQFYDDKILREDIHQIYHDIKLNSISYRRDRARPCPQQITY